MLQEQYRHQLGRSVSLSELRSWQRSFAVLSHDLHDAGLDQIEVLVEHRLPLSSKRLDIMLCGIHPRTRTASYVVVELKQWSRAHLIEGTSDLCEIGDGRAYLHPAAQVQRYCTYLKDFIAALSAPDTDLAGVAYLHNATDAEVGGLWGYPHDGWSRMFTGQRRGESIDFLRSHLDDTAGVSSADRFLNSAVAPSKQLMALAAEEVQSREQFVLLDEQQVAYSLVMRAVEQARTSNAKEVIVVRGGPGSGKSVIALSLLGELDRRGLSALHATGSSSFTQTLRRVAGRRARRVQDIFKYFNSFSDAAQNSLEVLICDEAHRIRETSANRFTRASLRTGRPQVEELINVARAPVLLLDEHQTVRPGEIGSVQDITDAASRLGLQTRVIDLDGQFRLGGSRVFEDWVLRLLELTPGGPIEWEGDPAFELSVDDSPESLEQRLQRHLERGDSSRISAGYSWPWSDPLPNGELAPDIVIGEWKRPWNNPKDSTHGDAPGRPYWATDPKGFGQVGCVYTAQGFEYDRSGVIMGRDLVWRGEHWVAQPEFSRDSQVKRGTIEEFDRSVRNTYKVLLTRAMKGTSLYSTDPETQALLKSLVTRSTNA